MKAAMPTIVALALLGLAPAAWADPLTAENRFEVKLPPHRFADALLPDSPFGINMAFAWMTRMVEGKRWVRNDSFGPDVFAVVFTDEAAGEDTIAAWANKPYAYVRVNNEKGLTMYDVFGTRRFVPHDRVRTASLPIPLGESPIYVVGPKGLKATVRPDPGW